jgi:hypothetical protein
MVAAVRESLTMKDVRRLVYGLLPLWGEIQRHGPLAPQRHGSIVSGAFGSRPPVPSWCTDLTLAFARLNPDTRHLDDPDRTAWLVHAPFNDEQRVIWAYYVPSDALPDAGPDTRAADSTIFAHQREAELKHAIKNHDSARDSAVAKLLHLDSRRVRYLRQGAVWALASLVGWERDT